ncbi:hypothetical protein M501DRAFT_1012736 [Patellaria atrata CBS 101060]|uniref:Uncharacterized protein n=1 Tax=Patellaria atrata CBS 101060 TaxID=1346257 RepID=A0A9P4SK93_9PEZI|nr:hypothetical protein M501DRAFT_1012736 [Patellaria atrata CBS 101060]
MASGSGPQLQLFPTPQKWPQRTTSRRTNPFRPAHPEPIMEKMEHAKAPADFHELVIHVSSAPNSPVIASPERAHTASTPPQAYSNFSPPQRSASRASRAPSPVSHPPQSRSVSPAFPPPQSRSITPALPPRAVSPLATIQTNVSPNPNHFVSPATSETTQTYLSPDRNRAASPAFSDTQSTFSPVDRARMVSPAFSDAPTLVYQNGVLTDTSPIQASEPAIMRSIFPTYNVNLPLSHQEYRPMHALPNLQIPMNKISRPTYSPAPVPSTSAPPYSTPANELGSLWDAANGQGSQYAPRTYTLAMHRSSDPASSSSSQTSDKSISFGPSASEPFYTLAQSTKRPTDSENMESNHAEVLIHRKHPNQQQSLPTAHLTVSPPPPPSISHDIIDEGQSILITTIYPKLAALAALDAAAQSPAAHSIAQFDPDATSPAAQRLAENAVREAAEKECCDLVWTRGSSPSGVGQYMLQHPTLGFFPITVEGDVSRGFASSMGPSSPYAHSANASGKIYLLNPFANPFSSIPGNASHAITPAEDAVLAKLDFANGGMLTLEAAGLRHLGNPHLIDVAVATLLSVAVAESKRGVDPRLVFLAPPSRSSSPAARSKASSKSSPTLGSATASPKEKGKGWWRQGSLKGKEKVREMDIEMMMPGEKKEKEKKTEGEHELPGVTRMVFTVVKFGAKAVVLILTVVFKVVGGVVIWATRRVDKMETAER